MAGNVSLGKAKTARKDEFYTQLTDIEKELRHYRQHFQGKTVLCNCDDPFESEFFKYFALNFNKLGLRKLIATCYDGSPIIGTQQSFLDLLVDGGSEPEADAPNRKPYKAVVTQVYDADGDGDVDMLDVAALLRSGENELTELAGNGDFRNAESLALLDEADIVVTNPPFSLFREYVTTLIEHGKKFIVIGPYNAIKYKETFPLFMADKIWLGYGFAKGDAYFHVPPENAGEYVDGVYNPETGLVHFRNCTWFTNLDIKKRHEPMILFRRYDAEAYPSYTNFDGIDVAKTSDIPVDYAGNMGVPVTFMEQYNPDQFEIVGLGEGDLAKEIGITRNHEGRTKLEYEAEPGVFKRPYARVVIRNRNPEEPRKQ